MKKIAVFSLAAALAVISGAACSRENSSAIEPQKVVAAETSDFKSPADANIEAAQKMVEKTPDAAASHIKLAAAYLKKVRETGDYEINRQAESSLKKALEIEPDNTDAMMLQTQIYLSEHKFREALELAQKTEKLQSSEAVLAAIVDAQTELGEYDAAVKSAQKLVDTRPTANAYARVAHLRALHGDTSGAIEARKHAVKIADPNDAEALAWHLSELGKEYFNAGKFAEAEQAFDASLNIFPDYHWALAGKGKVRAANNDLTVAAQIFEKLYARVPQTDRAIFLGDIYKKLGQEDEARKIYDEIVARETSKEAGDMHRIALFWADHDANLDEALKTAQTDRAVNKDLLASDTLAWCLYKKGNLAAARKYAAEAMRLKTKNALFFYHAGMIENALGNKKDAAKYLRLALETNPSFDLLQADLAREALRKL